MAKTEQKLLVFSETLQTLKQSIQLFDSYTNIFCENPTKPNELIFLATRDSLIQRFEYCTDLFWKLLRFYLEEVELVTLQTYSPRSIIRETVKTKTMTEQEGEQAITMIESRNKTSHIYHENTAKETATEIPEFYQLMKEISNKIQKK